MIMKKIHSLLLFVCFAFTISTPICATASFVSKPSANPVSESWKYLKLADCINLSPDDFSTFYGKRMNIWDKISFKIMKINMRKELKKNPDLLVSEYYSKNMQKRLGWGWWVLISLVALGILVLILLALAMASLNGTG